MNFSRRGIWVKVAGIRDLAPGAKKKIALDGKAILLVNLDGLYYAIDNKCPHMGGSLYDGNLEADVIVCPLKSRVKTYLSESN